MNVQLRKVTVRVEMQRGAQARRAKRRAKRREESEVAKVEAPLLAAPSVGTTARMAEDGAPRVLARAEAEAEAEEGEAELPFEVVLRSPKMIRAAVSASA